MNAMSDETKSTIKELWSAIEQCCNYEPMSGKRVWDACAKVAVELERYQKALRLIGSAFGKDHRQVLGYCKDVASKALKGADGTPNATLPPIGDGPRRKMLIEIEVTEDFERRLDNQWMVEREINADRWEWKWADGVEKLESAYAALSSITTAIPNPVLNASGASAMAYQSEQGRKNCGIERMALAAWLRQAQTHYTAIENAVTEVNEPKEKT